MKETSKSHPLRVRRGDYVTYLSGRGVDIGVGDDPLAVPDGDVSYRDLAQGDAQFLASVAAASLDFIYSSHCLEHLWKLGLALFNWSRVLKAGGHAHIVVPDYTLYEHHRWPSAHNADHEHSFSPWLGRDKVGRVNHWHLGEPAFADLVVACGFELIESELQDEGFDYSAGCIDQTLGQALSQILFELRKPI